MADGRHDAGRTVRGVHPEVGGGKGVLLLRAGTEQGGHERTGRIAGPCRPEESVR